MSREELMEAMLKAPEPEADKKDEDVIDV